MGAKVNTEGDEGPSSQQAGMYVGDGLPPVPARVAAKIKRWEFIEMYELLPEFWTQKGEETVGKPSTSSRAKAKRWVQDISVWLQCFALYVSLMANKSPQHIPELMVCTWSASSGPAKNMRDQPGLCMTHRRQATRTGPW